jgi:hypothetical protein
VAGAGVSRAGVASHTVGRIEAGTTWPDLFVVGRLTHVLGMHLTVAGSGWVEAVPGQRNPAPTGQNLPAAVSNPPLELGLDRGQAITSAHVVEALLHHTPAVRREVERLAHQRHNPTPTMTTRTGTRL